MEETRESIDDSLTMEWIVPEECFRGKWESNVR